MDLQMIYVVNLMDELFIALITITNMIGESDGWWIDIVSSRHVCYDREMFKTYYVTP